MVRVFVLLPLRGHGGSAGRACVPVCWGFYQVFGLLGMVHGRGAQSSFFIYPTLNTICVGFVCSHTLVLLWSLRLPFVHAPLVLVTIGCMTDNQEK